MNAIAIQAALDKTAGPIFRNNRYLTPVHSKGPAHKYKTHGAYARQANTRK